MQVEIIRGKFIDDAELCKLIESKQAIRECSYTQAMNAVMQDFEEEASLKAYSEQNEKTEEHELREYNHRIKAGKRTIERGQIIDDLVDDYCQKNELDVKIQCALVEKLTELESPFRPAEDYILGLKEKRIDLEKFLDGKEPFPTRRNEPTFKKH